MNASIADKHIIYISGQHYVSTLRWRIFNENILNEGRNFERDVKNEVMFDIIQREDPASKIKDKVFLM